MPRQLVQLYVVRTSQKRHDGETRFNKVYGPSYTDMVLYLAAKYGIHEQDVRAMLDDVFRYIEMEALLGAKGYFSVPRFGRFERFAFRNQSGEHIVLRLKRNDMSAPKYSDYDDEEWVDD